MMAQLFQYGIHNEASNLRAHVAPLARRVFIFPTISGKKAALMPGLRERMAFQPGVKHATAMGKLVKPGSIENIQSILISDKRFDGFTEDLSTSEKGDRAVLIVQELLKAGRFPLWVEGEFIKDTQIQINGTDVIVKGQWKIEVKCDFRASLEPESPHPRCTGNLFLQIAECNPLNMK
jgi:hypothetical protein